MRRLHRRCSPVSVVRRHVPPFAVGAGGKTESWMVALTPPSPHLDRYSTTPSRMAAWTAARQPCAWVYRCPAREFDSPLSSPQPQDLSVLGLLFGGLTTIRAYSG